MANSTSLKEKIVKGSIISITLTSIALLFTYFIRIIYSRTLSLEMYGLFYAVFGFFSVISVQTELGFGEAIAYLTPKYIKLNKYKEIWHTFIYGQLIQIGFAILISTILAILAPFLAKNYFKVIGSENLIYVFCFFIIINSILNSLLQIFTGLQKPKYYSSINVSKSALVLLLSLTLLLLDFHKPLYYGTAWVIGYFITTIIFLYLFYVKHPTLTRNSLSWEKETFNAMYKYAIPAITTTFFTSLFVSSDIFFLTLLRGIKEVGIYNIILPLASAPIVLLSPLNSILFPLVSSLYEGEKDKLVVLINKIYQFVPFVGIYFALFLILFPSSIVGLIFGQKWLGFTQTPLSFLALGYIAYNFSIILGIIILGMGKVTQRLKVLVVTGTFNVLLQAILINKIGVLGAVISNSLVALLLCLIFTNMIRKIVHFTIPYKLYFNLFFISTLVGLLIRISRFNPKNWFELIFAGILYTTMFIFLGLLLKIYDRKLVNLIFRKGSDL